MKRPWVLPSDTLSCWGKQNRKPPPTEGTRAYNISFLWFMEKRETFVFIKIKVLRMRSRCVHWLRWRLGSLASASRLVAIFFFPVSLWTKIVRFHMYLRFFLFVFGVKTLYSPTQSCAYHTAGCRCFKTLSVFFPEVYAQLSRRIILLMLRCINKNRLWQAESDQLFVLCVSSW